MLIPWPLERVAHLNEDAFCAIVQSIAQNVLARRQPLALPPRPLAVFAEMRWEDMGCNAEELAEVTARCNAMFHTEIPVPPPHEVAGMFCRAKYTQWRQGACIVTFFTSGSTGIPKPCSHQEDELRQEITSIAPLIGPHTAALVLAPLHHLYGFTFGLLLPLSLGIVARSALPLPTVAIAQIRPGDLIVGIPQLWTRIVESDAWMQQERPPGSITCITATEPIPASVLHALLQSGCRVLDFFGASEIGVVCWRDNPDASFTLLPHVRRGAEGRSETVLERLLPDGRLVAYPLQNVTHWTAPRQLLPGPRSDNAVQIGGINVYPDHVCQILEKHLGVQQCVVRIMRPEEGYRLKAFVVPTIGWSSTTLRRDLKALARQHLSDAECPAAYAFGADIPRGPLGKPSDW